MNKKLRTKILIFCISIFTPTMTMAWTAASRIETQPETQIIRSVIQFNKDSLSVVYKPTEPPYGSVSLEKVVFNKYPPYFISGWANGAHTMIFKVFNPEKHGNTPVCEYNSFSESAKLRIVKKVLELEIYPNDANEASWVPCKNISRKTQSTAKKKK